MNITLSKNRWPTTWATKTNKKIVGTYAYRSPWIVLVVSCMLLANAYSLQLTKWFTDLLWFLSTQLMPFL